MDSYKNFLRHSQRRRPIVQLHKKEAELLRPYVEGELKRRDGDIREEIQDEAEGPGPGGSLSGSRGLRGPHHGHARPGSLGVTFGTVVAMDSPSGRRPALSLGQHAVARTQPRVRSHRDQHRVPRWFTEGMAVHEETAASPDWGDRLDPDVISAIKGRSCCRSRSSTAASFARRIRTR